MGIGETRGSHDLSTGDLRVGERDVFAHGSAEEQWILGNDADLSAQGIKLDLSDVVAIDQNPTFLRVVKPR